MIVIALLGLLAFTGMVFYTFASQERAAAEYFSEAAKVQFQSQADVWPHMLEHVLNGPSERHRGSILYSPDRRHSLIRNLLGNDAHPHNGRALEVEYDALTGEPRLANHSGTDLLDFVDSPAARGGTFRSQTPDPDVDYTYPDINNLFLAWRGWAVRENAGGDQTQVPVIIPSFFRPQYMRQAGSDAAGSYSRGFERSFGGITAPVLTNPHWAYAYAAPAAAGQLPSPVAPTINNRDSVLFSSRSFRPHPSHLAGTGPNGDPVLRYLTDDEATAPGISLTAGGFPFLPDESGRGNGLRGDLGLWTGSDDLAYELDTDNDGDGITEGIWLDLRFPIQEHQEANGSIRTYAVLHSVTIYDLDGLFNLNVHGNLAGLPREGMTSAGSRFLYTLPLANSDGHLSTDFLSRSHHGMGPHEINPLWGLRRGHGGSRPFEQSLSDESLAHMFRHFGGWPTHDVQQANMEWIWLLTGRGDYQNFSVTRSAATGAVTGARASDLRHVLPGRWGDQQLVFHALEQAANRLRVVDLPRPGRSGRILANGLNAGFDDNRNLREGEGLQFGSAVIQRPFGHPVSFSGKGRRTRVDRPVYDPTTGRFSFSAGNEYFSTDIPLSPILIGSGAGPERFPAYLGYSASSTPTPGPRHTFGVDGAHTGTNAFFRGTPGDDLNHDPVFDDLFEDPLETIFDQDRADRAHDTLATFADLVALQWPSESRAVLQLSDSQDRISTRLTSLAPHGLAMSSDNREMFTTHSNSLRRFSLPQSAQRSWEFSADTDGPDRNDDGFGDGDKLLEFPPAFGTTATSGRPFSQTDPFRPAVRRLLTHEHGDKSHPVGSLPLSLNHIVDVARTDTPLREGTTAWLRHVQRAGLQLRRLTEHPVGAGTSQLARDVRSCSSVPTLELTTDRDRNTVKSAADVRFPPRTISEQEFWARRDRQQLARDIYVLLYSIGGAEQTAGGIRDYTGPNDPDAGTGNALYSHEQLRRMAQFAVNMVDAMDTDSVMTKFEYDKNLGDGWNLDDDPFTSESGPLPEGPPGTSTRAHFDRATARGLSREDTSSRGVVYGVEAQQLAFSEVMAVRCGATQSADHKATLHDDEDKTRDHLFVELKNVRPQSISLGGTTGMTPETAIFRIARYDRLQQEQPLGAPANPTAAITFLPDAGTIGGGEQFTMAVASDDSVISSDLFVDWDLNGIFELIAPNVATATLPTRRTGVLNHTASELQPRTNLDLIHPNHSKGRYVVTDSAQRPTSLPGAFLDQLEDYLGNGPMNALSSAVASAGGDFSFDGGKPGFDLVLQRRLNPEMPSVRSSSGQQLPLNPWVEVDRIRVEFSHFRIEDSDTTAELTGPTGRLSALRSFERREPLDDSSRREFPMPLVVSDYRFNSIGSDFNRHCLRDPQKPRNESSSSADYNPLEPVSVWQPHFDRDFVSPGELLHLPLFAPALLTQRLSHSRLGPHQQTIATAVDHQVSGAAAMFLRPEFAPSEMGKSHLDNRWYRLFQFAEVPSRLHRMLGNYLAQTKLPGRINLNMIRHPEVLAGLIDDPIFADTDRDRLSSPFLIDRTPGTINRDRWTDFVRERDGLAVDGYFDPTPAQPGSGDEATRFRVPGTPGSRPFRPFGYTRDDADDNGIEHTILRRLMQDRDEDEDGDDDELKLGWPADDDNHDLLPDDSGFGSGEVTNRHWLEVGGSVTHTSPGLSTTAVERHQVLSKIMNNTTTVSNVFVIFATAAYFEAWEDPASGLYRIGGRIDLDGNDRRNPGWQQRAVFVIDRTEAVDAYDSGTGEFDWRRLIKYEAQIE